MADKLIYLITAGEINPTNFAEKLPETIDLLKFAIEQEVSMIQIREKQLPAKLIFRLTQKIVDLKQNSKTKILVNERADIALAAKADGVHLTSTSIPVKYLRQFYPKNFVIGVSTHFESEIVKAKRQGADFVTFSPIFSKNAVGIEKLKEMVKSAGDFPVIALGGIDEKNITEVWQSGAAGIAAIRFLNNRKNLQQLLNERN